MKSLLPVVALVLVVLAAVVPSAGQTQTPSDTLLIAKDDDAQSNADLTVLISQETFTQSNRIILARDDAFADALASGVLQSDGPLMLVPSDGPVPRLMADEIQRLGAREAVVLGGPAAVDPEVENQLVDLGLDVSRRQGATRFETAIEIARQDAPDAETVMLARAFGANPDDPSQAFADSIAAGGISAREGFPVLLTDTLRLNDSTKSYLGEGASKVKRVLILGGTAAVSAGVEAELVSMGMEVERVAGASREDTAIEVAKVGGDESAADVLRVIAADSQAEDAWAGGFAMASHAKMFDAPIVLTNGDDVPDATKDFLEPGIGGNAFAQSAFAQSTFAQSTPVLTCVTTAAVCEEVRIAAGLPPAQPTETPTPTPTPTQPPPPFSATQVVAGVNHSCGLAPDGSAWCWGQSGSPALGYQGTADTTTAVPVSGGHTFVQLTAGGSHTCGVTGQGQGWCWGANSVGQLGDLTTTTSFTPRMVAVQQPLRSIDAGVAHTCAVAVDDSGWCWGANPDGRLGSGNPDSMPHPQPVHVSSGEFDFATISAGAAHSCGITPSGSALCWGANPNGALGNGTTDNAAFPTFVESDTPSGQLSWGSISAGASHTCALTINGIAYCWGDNSFGQLGDGGTMSSTTPQVVTPGATYQQISAGEHHTCARSPQGGGMCWGQNGSGELGDGTTEGPGPVPVSGDLQFSTIDAGWDHTCGVVDGIARCWGSNADGRIGDGTTTNRSTPVFVGRNPRP